ncbi:MAG: hypothetical protein KF871_11165 [Hydrogenophaga sp.]|uniref:hypothetical protein n=1 Tax=Hydrogenophaga sp. TaxID=1904254 RepID=UPI001D2DBE73|nr:hypothetical protein [Hydrogenophaga sp.]MBX3610443.1 hypothetical protein [Hydrogenophaga sp.]
MKQFFSTLFDTVAQRLHSETRHEDPHRLMRIRQAMVELVGPVNDWESELLRHRVLVADSAKSLWFLRPALLQWLCRRHDERAAMGLVMSLQPLFEGMVEASLLTPSAAARRARRDSSLGL